MGGLRERVKGMLPAGLKTRVRRLIRPLPQHIQVLSRTIYSGPVPETVNLDNPLERIFWTNSDRAIHKWHHYLGVYHRHFERFRDTGPTVLEIGVQNGGSMRMWREYFGKDAVIFGIDIDPACAALDGEFGSVRIGSQADPSFLRAVLAESGPPDIVIDDGSHVMAHIRASLQEILPAVRSGGVYLIEDLQCAYWPHYGGGHKSRQNFFRDVLDMIDDMHAPYHGGPRISPISGLITGLHVHDGIVVLDRGQPNEPRHSVVGSTFVVESSRIVQTAGS